MAMTKSSIEPLPVQAQLQLKSSVSLNSLNDAIIGLIKNSLDSQGQTIHVEVDFSRGCCCVEDDGIGIPAKEFEESGGLGLMHYTSKFATTDEAHGQHGRFLASLSALSLLSISSRHVSEKSESNIIYHYSQVLTSQRNVSEKERRVGARNGTKVVARDMFGNLPVRTKQRAIHFGIVENVERALDRLKMQITALALALSKPVRIVVSDQIQQKRKLVIGKKANACGYDPHPTREWPKMSAFRLDHICTLLSDAGCINPTDFDSWTSVSARTSQIFVRAAFSLEPAPSKQVQFISLGIQPLDSSSALSQVLYREVNLLFAESAFGNIEDDLDVSEEEHLRRRRFKVGGPTGRQLKGKGKGADRFPMFYIRISPREEDIPLGLLGSDEDDNHAAKFLEKTVLLISSMVHQFLQDRHFRPRAMRRTSGLLSPRKQFTANSRPSHPPRNCSYPANFVESSQEESEDHTKIGSEDAHAILISQAQPKVSQKASSAIPFCSWSRIKSGQPGALNDLLSGLPSSKISHDLQHRSSESRYHAEHFSSPATHGVRHGSLAAQNLKEDIELLLRDLDDEPYMEDSNQPNVLEHKDKIAPQLSVSEHEEEICLLGLNNSEDSIVFWQNPASGEIIRVNARTGLSLSDLPSRPSNDSKHWTSNPTNPNSSRFRGSLRHRSSDGRLLDLCARLQSESNTWLGGLLRGWQNPAFRLKESPIPSVDLGHTEEIQTKSKKCYHGQYSHCIESEIVGRKGRLSKAALRDATILGQVDRKFILAVMGTSVTDMVKSTSDDTVLVLIDQHAADERCRVEDLCEEISNTTAMRLPKPITFEVTKRELELFRRERRKFEIWGVLYKVGAEKDTTKNTQAVRAASAHLPPAKRSVDQDTNKRPTTAIVSRTTPVVPRDAAKGSSSQVVVHALPELIAERCRLDPKMLIDMLRSEVWGRTESTNRASTLLTANGRAQRDAEKDLKAHSWLKRISSCPRGLIDLLNSRACRSAIMFNDELTQKECERLVRKLAKCAFPFQCAHGRPSLVVLGPLESRAMQLPKDNGAEVKESQAASSASQAPGNMSLDFLPAFTAWQQRDMGRSC